MKITNLFKITLALILSLALLTSSCSIKSPVSKIKTGIVESSEIQVAMPDEAQSDVDLNLEFATGELNITPGAEGMLVSGTATCNADELRPVIDASTPSVLVRSGEKELDAFPISQDDLINQWDLQLSGTPMSLNIHAGPYNGNFELGGLALKNLVIDEVGSDVSISFAAPNPVDMDSFTYSTGGSTMTITGLANANFEEMTFKSGAGDYTLSFDGELQRDTNVTIDTGVSTVNIIVPLGTQAQVTFEGGLSSVNAGDGWAQNQSVYTHTGSGPTITIIVKMGMGTLNLTTE